MAEYLPTASEDAQRAQLISQFFWTAGNLMAGTDSVLRMDPSNQRSDGLMGPPGSAVSYGVAPDGRLYVRGSAGYNGAAVVNGPESAGLRLSPGVLILAGLLFLMVRR